MIDPGSSRQLMLELGFSSEDCDALLESGIHAIDLTAGATDASFCLFSSEPVDVLGADFTLDEYQRRLIDGRRILLLDTWTGAAFSPVAMGSAALYGRTGSQLLPPPAGRLPDFTARARYCEVGFHVVRSMAEAEEIASAVRESVADRPGVLLFRGQDRNYRVHRHRAVADLLFGEEAAEVSLASLAMRTAEEFDSFAAEPYWKALYEDLAIRQRGSPSNFLSVESVNETFNVDRNGDFAAGLYQQSAALAQTYGLPAFVLGATSLLAIACWFALRGRHSPAGDREDWPVVHILHSIDAINTASSELPLLRAKAQSNYFLTGSWGAHRNVCANDLLCTLVLAPEFPPSLLSREELFPGPEDDPILATLLDLRRTAPLLSAKLGLQYLAMA